VRHRRRRHRVRDRPIATGKLYYYDINALSNFVADAPRVVGFDAFSRLADYLEQEHERGTR